MRDLIDAHRANIAKAGLALAEAINEATTAYTLAVAASEAELEVMIERRVAQFHGGDGAVGALVSQSCAAAPPKDFLPDPSVQAVDSATMQTVEID